jgi:hypothetical protein
VAGPRLSAGLNSTCLLASDGTPTCWGGSNIANIDFPAKDVDHWTSLTPQEQLQQISHTQDGACALRKKDCSIVCWGDPGDLVAPTTGSFVEVIAGFNVVCGRRADGTLTCWGGGSPATPVSSDHFTMLSTLDFVTCGLSVGGTAECWNLMDDGPPYTPGLIDGPFVKIAQSDVLCGLLGNGTLLCPTATDIPPGQFVDLVSSFSNKCALRADGTAVCWGNHSPGLGGSVQPPPNERVASLTIGSEHACGLTFDGRAVCWGSGKAAMPPPGTFVELAAGAAHTCGLRSNGTVACWGVGEPGDPTGDPNSGSWGQSTVPASLQ